MVNITLCRHDICGIMMNIRMNWLCHRLYKYGNCNYKDNFHTQYLLVKLLGKNYVSDERSYDAYYRTKLIGCKLNLEELLAHVLEFVLRGSQLFTFP